MRFGVARSLTASGSEAQIHPALTPAAAAEQCITDHIDGCSSTDALPVWQQSTCGSTGDVTQGSSTARHMCRILRLLFAMRFTCLPGTQHTNYKALQAAACLAGSWTSSQQTQDFWSTAPHRWAAAESLLQSSATLRLRSLAFPQAVPELSQNMALMQGLDVPSRWTACLCRSTLKV